MERVDDDKCVWLFCCPFSVEGVYSATDSLAPPLLGIPLEFPQTPDKKLDLRFSRSGGQGKESWTDD